MRAAIAYGNGILKIRVHPGKPFVVFGPGAVGTCFVLFAKLLGAYPVVSIGRRDEPLERARKLGADAAINNTKQNVKDAVLEVTRGAADAVIDAVGDMAFLSSAPELLAPGGRLGFHGIDTSMDVRLNLLAGPDQWSLAKVSQDETRVQDQSIDYIRRGAVRLSDFYSHVVPLAGLKKGFDLLLSKEAFRIVARMGAP